MTFYCCLCPSFFGHQSRRRTAFPVTAELCLQPQKKTSLSGWLPLPQLHPVSPGHLFFFPCPTLTPLIISSTSFLKLQIASNPA
jgi:hypothetical protein